MSARAHPPFNGINGKTHIFIISLFSFLFHSRGWHYFLPNIHLCCVVMLNPGVMRNTIKLSMVSTAKLPSGWCWEVVVVWLPDEADISPGPASNLTQHWDQAQLLNHDPHGRNFNWLGIQQKCWSFPRIYCHVDSDLKLNWSSIVLRTIVVEVKKTKFQFH